MAINMGNFLGTLVLHEEIAGWLMTTMREELIMIGANGGTGMADTSRSSLTRW